MGLTLNMMEGLDFTNIVPYSVEHVARLAELQSILCCRSRPSVERKGLSVKSRPKATGINNRIILCLYSENRSKSIAILLCA